MTWTINGKLSEVGIIISSHGNTIIRGKGSHNPYIIDDYVDSEYPATADTLRRLQKVQAEWRILSTDAVKTEIIDNASLLHAIKAKPGKSIVEITCLDDLKDEESALSFNIALLPPILQQVYDLFTKFLAGYNEAHYMIYTDFLMFRPTAGKGDKPSLDELRSGHPYFSDEVSVSARHANYNNP